MYVGYHCFTEHTPVSGYLWYEFLAEPTGVSGIVYMYVAHSAQECGVR